MQLRREKIPPENKSEFVEENNGVVCLFNKAITQICAVCILPDIYIIYAKINPNTFHKRFISW